MFKKIPHGVKVRVIGNEVDGYIVQQAICCLRFLPLPFLDDFTTVGVYIADKDMAIQHANNTYDSWMRYYARKEAAKARAKSLKKHIVWRKP